jgi:hypothetical protein
MGRDEEMDTPVSSDCGSGMAERALHPLVMRCLPSTVAQNGHELWIDAHLSEWDAPISVWWDHPPEGSCQ